MGPRKGQRTLKEALAWAGSEGLASPRVEEQEPAGNTAWAQAKEEGSPLPSTLPSSSAQVSLVTSGWHPDAEVLPQLLQEHEGEHSVGDKTDTRRKEALVKGLWSKLCCLHCTVENTLQKQ